MRFNRTIHRRMGEFAAVTVDNGENWPPVFIESLIGEEGPTATRWCEVLGEPGVDRVKRAMYMVRLLAAGSDVTP